MAFLVYFFVLLVAGASVVFGLDWTQAPLNPPPYATLPAQTASVAPASKPAPAKPAPAVRSVAVAKTDTVAKTDANAQRTAAAPAALDQAAQAQASATAADTAAVTSAVTPAAAASCNVNACSAAYRSFRASDCSYQPLNGERRLCTKSGSTGKVAVASHPRNVRRAEPRDDYRSSDRRFSDRRDYYDRRDAYDDRRGGGLFGGLFGGGDDE